MELRAGRIAELAGRPVGRLTRRDVAYGLLTVDPGDALESLPLLRRGLLAAGNPMSVAYWQSTEQVLAELQAGTARTGDVRAWLEATGTEPAGVIGLHVWDEPPERSRIQADLHNRLVRHLEEKLAAGELDPDALATGDADARLAWTRVQDQWMNSPLSDGRIPMDLLLAEQDAEFLAEWAEADVEALSALQVVLDEVGDRPLPLGELAVACARARAAITGDELTGRLLATCGETGAHVIPAPDPDWWLTLAAGVVAPAGDTDDEEVSAAISALSALEHVDWLAAMAALARGGPGTPAAPGDLARYAREYCDDDFDEPAVIELFSPVADLWQALGAIDTRQRLTSLGWWGLPEAVRKVWTLAR
ncbi:MAG TPA: hypothetical protein VN847_07745 [Streptosporangiaceae bacterium]|nr:hypothetical protein [Streptosporangiaceae bacterium]